VTRHPKKFTSRVVLVTGAASGIGRERAARRAPAFSIFFLDAVSNVHSNHHCLDSLLGNLWKSARPFTWPGIVLVQ
jgi:NAD(P)-dependent dehydrogenase (short-subunit alcohol dehydrogenase family)